MLKCGASFVKAAKAPSCPCYISSVCDIYYTLGYISVSSHWRSWWMSGVNDRVAGCKGPWDVHMMLLEKQLYLSSARWCYLQYCTLFRRNHTILFTLFGFQLTYQRQSLLLHDIIWFKHTANYAQYCFSYLQF